MTIYSELRDYADLDREDAVAVMTNMRDSDRDFEMGNYRFVRTDALNEILAEELSNDEYILGCFNTGFICDNVPHLEWDVVDALKEAEAFEGLGKLILSLVDMEEFAAAYASADSYGAHFNRYDGTEIEIGEYHAFQQN